MAVRIGLSAARRVAAPLSVITLLTAGVLLAHALVLSWLASALPAPTALKAMAEPMFTRLLAPAPAPPEAVPLAQAPQASPVMPPSTAEAAAIPPLASESSPTPASSAQASSAIDTWPTDTRLTYLLGGQFRGGPLYGDARVQWQRQGALYQAQVQVGVQLAGSFSMTSQGEVTPAGLVPRAYEEQRRNRSRAVRLTDTAVVLPDGQSVPRPADVQDIASQFVELGHRFATGRQALALGGTVDIWLARPGGVDKWTYDVTAQDLLRTPRHGEVLAWRLTPRPNDKPRSQVSAEIWFAPSLQYLPVRIRLAMGEEAQVDLMVDTIEQR